MSIFGDSLDLGRKFPTLGREDRKIFQEKLLLPWVRDVQNKKKKEEKKKRKRKERKEKRKRKNNQSRLKKGK